MKITQGYIGAALIFAVLPALGISSSAFSADSGLVQEIRQKVDAKQYQDAQRQITTALSAIRSDDEGTDRFQLLMLRGECLLQTGQRASAVTAYELALRCAPDTRGAALARAHVLLLKASFNNQYKPKQGANTTPIDILDRESRKAAFAAMREDQAKTLAPGLRTAMQAHTLPPMLNVLQPLLDVGYLEYASKGSAEETRAELQSLGMRARELINADLRRIRRETSTLEIAANSAASDYTRRGLFSQERTQAKETIEYLKKIEQTARDVRRRAIELGFDGSAWEPIIAESADVADRLQALLDVPS